VQRYYGWIGSIFVGITLAAGLSIWRPVDKAVAKEIAPRSVLTVTSTAPSRLSWPNTVTASGAIAAWQEAIIGTQTGGLQVVAIYVDVNSEVRAGKLLAELASDAAQAELRRLVANLAAARATSSQAKSNVERARIAKQGSAISDQSYNEYLIAEQTAQANVDAASAQVDAQRIVLARTRIVAVDDGLITTRSVVLGKVVQTGDELFRMIRQNRLEWQAEVDAGQMSKVQPGQYAKVKLPTGEEISGRVRIASPSLSTSSGRGIVYVSLSDKAAHAGMFANGQIETGVSPALTVPQSAIATADGYHYLFKLEENNRVRRLAIKTGRRQDDRVEIVEGLDENTHIVATGAAFLADGDLVTVTSNPAPVPKQ